MVQIATAEQDKLQEAVANGVPMIETGIINGQNAIVENLQPGQFFARVLMRQDNPNMGWSIEEGQLDEERAQSLRGALAENIEVIGSEDPAVRMKVKEIDTDNPQNHQEIAEYVGLLAAFRWTSV
jgi:hypothetical protein